MKSSIARRRPTPAALVIVSHQSPARKSNSFLRKIRRDLGRGRDYHHVYLSNIAVKDGLEAIARQLYDEGLRRMDVFPYFLHDGFHVRVELPKRLKAIRLRLKGLAVRQRPHLGSHPDLLRMVRELTGSCVFTGQASRTGWEIRASRRTPGPFPRP